MASSGLGWGEAAALLCRRWGAVYDMKGSQRRPIGVAGSWKAETVVVLAESTADAATGVWWCYAGAAVAAEVAGAYSSGCCTASSGGCAVAGSALAGGCGSAVD